MGTNSHVETSQIPLWDQSVPVGVGGRLCAVAGFSLGQDTGHVVGNRAEADDQLVRNLLVAAALGH